MIDESADRYTGSDLKQVRRAGGHAVIKRLILATAPCVLVLWWGISAARAQTEPARVGLSLGLSGRYAVIAKMQERAFRMWEFTTNQQGGILGRKIQLTIYDDRSDKETAKKLYRRMIEQEKMDLLFPPYSSSLTTAILPLTEAHGYPMLIHGAAADSIWKQGYRYVFGLFPPASRYTLGFQEMLLINGVTRLAVISADDSFSESIAKGAEQWAARLGLQIKLRRTIKKGTSDLAPVAREARSSGAQGVIMCGHFNETFNLRQAMIDIGWRPKAFWASVGPVFQSYYDRFGAEAENTFTVTQWTYSDKLPFPGTQSFHDGFLKKYGVEPSYHAACAYAAGLLLAEAVRKAGGIDRNRIRDILAEMDKMTLLGRYGVDRTGMQIRFFHLTIQWIDGRKEIVWPVELQTAKPRFP